MARAVLFDVDGVLIDSAEMYVATWGAWADLRAIDREVLLAGIEGERGVDAIARVAPGLDVEVELALLVELVLEHELKSVAFAGAGDLLARYAGRCALVTSGPRAGTLARLARLGLPVPRAVVCGEDVLRGKPDPEPYLRGASLLGIAPADCVVVEDAPAGIAAGRAAGAHVLALSTSVSPAECADAHEVLPDLTAVAERLAELIDGA